MLGIFSSKVSPRSKQSLQGWILLAWLGVWTQRTAAQGPGAEVVTAAEGQTAALRAPFTADILVFNWYKGTGTLASQQIIGYVVPTSKQTNGPLYTGRESVTPDGTLTIRDLRTSDTGTYTVSVTRTDTSVTTASRQLSIYEVMTKPTVTSVPSQLVENRGPAEITCDTLSAAVTILWSFNNSPDLPGSILPSPDNRTLTIANVSRGDTGIYQCVALNPVSSSASDPWTLTVAYGPGYVKIYPPGSHSVQNGAKLSLSCTAESFPEPRYQWFLNDTVLNRPVSTYTIETVSSRDNGNYTCVAHNMATNLTAKASVYIVVTNRPCSTPDSCWQTTLGVACGILLGAAIIVAVMAVHYERRLKQMGTNKDENMYQNPSIIKNADTPYENVKKGQKDQSANPDSAADPAYMELNHGDRATYEQIKRP